ncbi:S-adenosyl-L-methionine-dependent methyltransferase [Xylariaceae sp. FL0662B]|nr:S-adenosyl-L-methionine-dependent methyltransferase [Xylariaceae sp. FL0662B]
MSATLRCHVRNIFFTSSLLRRHTGCRTFAAKTLQKSEVRAEGEVAEKLAATKVWAAPAKVAKVAKRTPKKSKSAPKIQADKTRVHIVSEKLCDDIINYIGPSLDRHKGCDIIDIYPGAGVWSRKLHEYLQPRSHILMETDVDMYKPFLQPLLDRPGTTVVPKSGLVWRDLNSVLTPEYLPHQVVPDASRLTQRNDTLLVTANLSFHPKKRFYGFSSIAQLVLHQFVDIIRTSSSFQRYGLVRMLIWAPHDDKWAILPKCMQKRRRAAVEAELYCEWVREVCGRPGPSSDWFIRDSTLDLSGNLAVFEKMRAAKLKMPSERESEYFKEARSAASSGQVIVPGSTPPRFKRRFQEALFELEAAHEEQLFEKDSDDYKTMRGYRWRLNSEARKHQRIADLSQGLDSIIALHKSGQASAEEIEALQADWDTEMKASLGGFIEEFITFKDNLHYYRQDPPLLHWDRRVYEPMVVQPEEFFPNIEGSLLDIQPKEVHPLFRQVGPRSNRAGDCFELIMAAMMSQGTQPVAQTMDALAPGASDYIMPRWKSARDLDHGGVVLNSRFTALTPRMLNARQWEEFMELWMEWPFRPEFHELVSRTTDDLSYGSDDGTSEM